MLSLFTRGTTEIRDNHSLSCSFNNEAKCDGKLRTLGQLKPLSRFKRYTIVLLSGWEVGIYNNIYIYFAVLICRITVLACLPVCPSAFSVRVSNSKRGKQDKINKIVANVSQDNWGRSNLCAIFHFELSEVDVRVIGCTAKADSRIICRK